MIDSRRMFESIYRTNIERDGADELLNWLYSTDFFEAPASTKYHLTEAGGLCEHSVNVYRRLLQFLKAEYPEEDCPYSTETIALISLLHDICKIGMYKVGWRNQKTYDYDKVSEAPQREVRHDNGGNFIWETVPMYEIDDSFIYGHGEKSVYLIQKFVKLSDDEAQAIRFHMGPFQDGEARNYSKACVVNPLVFFLYMADSAATYLDEM